MPLPFVLRPDRRLEFGFFFCSPLSSLGLDGIALNPRQNRGCLFSAHHGDPRIWPHPEETRGIGAPAHAVVSGSERAADNHRKFRYLRGRYRGNHLGAVAGNPFVFIFFTHHEAGNILEEYQRDASLAAELDEMSSLLSGLRKENSVICQYTDRVTPNARKPADQGDTV